MTHIARQAAQWLRRNLELTTLILLALTVLGVWGFAELADEVLEGSTTSLDRRVLLWFRDTANPDVPHGPWWVQEVGRDLTALGGVAVLALATALTTGFVLLTRAFASALFLVVSVLGGIGLSSVAKIAFDRPRPDLVSHLSLVQTASFPSGHAMMAAVTYLTLGILIAQTQQKRGIKAYIMAVAILLTLLVGISRVYLGVHWPTDVLAGWVAGAVWAILCFLAARGAGRFTKNRRDGV